MATRDFFNQFKTGTPERVTIDIKFTGAADVAATGYTVNRGTQFVSAVTRTAEGKAKIALKDTWPSGLVDFSLNLLGTGDTVVNVENDTSTDTSDPHVDVVFVTGGADTDPDSGVAVISLSFANTGVTLL